jgi:hypothetical protein
LEELHKIGWEDGSSLSAITGYLQKKKKGYAATVTILSSVHGH